MTIGMMKDIIDAWVNENRFDLARKEIELETRFSGDNVAVTVRDFADRPGKPASNMLLLDVSDVDRRLRAVHFADDVPAMDRLKMFVEAQIVRLVGDLVSVRDPRKIEPVKAKASKMVGDLLESSDPHALSHLEGQSAQPKSSTRFLKEGVVAGKGGGSDEGHPGEHVGGDAVKAPRGVGKQGQGPPAKSSQVKTP